ncbi:MAG: MFS transporter [Sphingorhabdus sp.]
MEKKLEGVITGSGAVSSEGEAIVKISSVGLLIAATIGAAVNSAPTHIIGAMMTPLQSAYGWSRAEIALALTMSTLIHPFTNVALGLLVDRFGPRRVALPGVAAFSLGLAGLGVAGPALWSWYVAYVLFAVLTVGISYIVWTKAVVDHFDKRRGLALAFTLAGTGVMVSIVPNLVLWVDGSFGIRAVYPMIALAAFVLIFPLAWIFLPRKTDAHKIIRKADAPHWSEVISDSRLWRMALAFVFVAACVGIFIVHLQPILTDGGMTKSAAANVAFYIGPSLIIGRLATGVLFDIFPARLVSAVAFLLPALACLMMMEMNFTPTSTAVLAVLIGLGMGSELDVAAYLASRYFSLAHYGLVFAILNSVYGLAIGIAAWAAGKVYDASNSYDSVLGFLAAGCVFAVLLIVTLGKPRQSL